MTWFCDVLGTLSLRRCKVAIGMDSFLTAAQMGCSLLMAMHSNTVLTTKTPYSESRLLQLTGSADRVARISSEAPMTLPLSPSRRECHVNRPDLDLFPVVKRCFQGGRERGGNGG